ncbi:MAG TPA: hypothetical protein VG962_10510, partial [Steroidobacteraceae bacterium]|nr:hypothetical protein [Steroidobacteraceae bacterium]
NDGILSALHPIMQYRESITWCGYNHLRWLRGSFAGTSGTLYFLIVVTSGRPMDDVRPKQHRHRAGVV